MVLQNIIACFYDCDNTLTKGNMQEPMLRKYGVNPEEFWKEVNALKEEAQKENPRVEIEPENAYMIKMIEYAEQGVLKDLSNAQLRQFGKEIELFPGLPDFFLRTKRMIEENPVYHSYGIKLEHYIISTGLTQMILGSDLNVKGAIDGVFASGFYERDGRIWQIGKSVGQMKKTEFLHMVNKGANVYGNINVNDLMPEEIRRVSWSSMLAVFDGPTDVPVGATINKRGGKCVAVYNPNSEDAFERALQLNLQGRVLTFGEADYRENSHTSKILECLIRGIADKIVKDVQDIVKSRSMHAPHH